MVKVNKIQQSGVERFNRGWRRLARQYDWKGFGKHSRRRMLRNMAEGTYWTEREALIEEYAYDMAFEFGQQDDREARKGYEESELVIARAEKRLATMPMSVVDDLVYEESTYY